MATLVLGTVGRIFGGPLGGIIGSVVGGVVDRGLFGGGGGGSRQVGRIGNLAVQSAAYGEPIPFIAGRMRVAGNLLWTAGIAETATRSGGGKRSGPATTTYSYSSSFAVGLAGRVIADVGRIWADGKLIRDAGGDFITPAIMRLHRGSEGQAVDPLIGAAEGIGGAPAYRGIAYVVFEDLPLAEYGNRIPNLTFEIIADATDNAGAAIGALAEVEGRPLAEISGAFPSITGHFSGRSGSVAEALAPLLEMTGAVIAAREGLVVLGAGGDVAPIAAADSQARAAGDDRRRDRSSRLGGEAVIGGVEIAFYDTSRDFQPGLQRVRRDAGGAIDHRSVASAMAPGEAKTLATAMLARAQASRLRASVRLPWRYIGLRPGMQVAVSDDPTVWRVRETRFEGFVVDLELERVEAAPPTLAASDGGRVLAFDDRPAGPTMVQWLDLPPLPGELPTLPRLWIAAAGASPGWRRAGIEVSGDAGGTYAVIGTAEGGTVQGVATTALAHGTADAWDRFAAVEVELLSETMWLEGRSEASVLAGANLALIGNEIVQFAEVEAIAPRRFRLSMLLRGRRGTEAAIAGHAAGERFVLLDPQGLLAFDPPIEALGRSLRARAIGAGDAAAVPVVGEVRGLALRPLSPAHLRLAAAAGDVRASWIRRSRAGFGWSDFVDAPLAEAIEAYRVTVMLDGHFVREATVSSPLFSYAAGDRVADGNGAVLTIDVAQIGASTGPGAVASATLIL